MGIQIYQCPNCGETYSEFQNKYYCIHCNYRLKKQEDIKKVKHPELSKRNYKVIGTVQDPTAVQVECPYCHSTNTKKISDLSKGLAAVFCNFPMPILYNEWHCNNCKSDF